MDERLIPSTAIYAGGLAHTFEYRTTGVHVTPHLHWSFPLREGATISCPVLVAEGVVYVGDSAGFFSALDAHSGDLLWCFATDWAQDGRESRRSYEFTGVTAFCLAGRRGYVASAYRTLYELDLRDGQMIRLWNREALEEDPDEIEVKLFSLFFYDQFVWIQYGYRMSEYVRTFRLDPATGNMVLPERFPDGFSASGDDAPVIYSPPQGNVGVAYIAEFLDSNAHDFVFYAVNLSCFGPRDPVRNSAEGNGADPILWSMGEGEDYDEFGGLFTLLDEILYAVSCQRFFDDDDISIELLALDPFTGAVQWRYPILECISEREDLYYEDQPIQLAAASHLIFLVTNKGVEAVDTHTHQQRWKWTNRISDRDERHVLVADGLLFVLDEAGQVTALDAHTGEQRWSWQAEQPITGRFSTIADATLYLAMGHTLRALR